MIIIYIEKDYYLRSPDHYPDIVASIVLYGQYQDPNISLEQNRVYRNHNLDRMIHKQFICIKLLSGHFPL